MNINPTSEKGFLGGWRGLRELFPNNPEVWSQTFTSLHSRNYRLYFCGQMTSLIGSFIQNVALSWLVYRMTGSVILLATVTFLSQIPTFFITPFTGVLVDRFNRHKMLLATQAAFMIQALMLAFLTLSNLIEVWHILALSLFVGLINAFDMPARHAFTPDLVLHKEDLSNAIALNSAMFNSARLIGPSIGGLLIGFWGEGYCFLLNGVSYLAVLGSLLAMNVPVFVKKISEKNILQEMNEGFAYITQSLSIKSALLMTSTISFFGFSLLVFLPPYAKDTLHGDSNSLGFLMSSIGAGALVAALYLAARKSVMGLGKIIMISSFVLGLSITILSQVDTDWIAYLLCFPIGFTLISSVASMNTQLQTLADEKMRGRVMSFYTMALMGVVTIGAMLLGFLEKYIGLSNVILTNGIACILAAFVYEKYRPTIRQHMRAIYREKGIIPEIATGMESAGYK